jgi:predicted TIM-barrel fold metal-dependent hydrolase
MAVHTRLNERRVGAGRAGLPAIDVDVHPGAAPDQIDPWMPNRWRNYRPWGQRHMTMSLDLTRLRERASRSDAFPPSGGPPGSDPDFIVEQLLDRYDLSYGMLNVITPGDAGSGPLGFTQAVCRATNHWLAEGYLAKDPRWVASLAVPYEYGGSAVVREIENWASEKRFRQVFIAMRTEKPLGDPKYWDMYETCEALGLAVAIHPGNAGNNTATGAGWPSFYFEDHAGYPQVVPTHAASMICEGVFDRFPKLRFVVVEGGWTYASWLAARLDSSWRVMRDEVTDLQRLPSEYLREHFWYTTQPFVDEPDKKVWLVELLERSGVEDRLMFSSDYPHWDFDSPNEVIPEAIPLEVRRKLFYENACKLYGLTIDEEA